MGEEYSAGYDEGYDTGYSAGRKSVLTELDQELEALTQGLKPGPAQDALLALKKELKDRD